MVFASRVVAVSCTVTPGSTVDEEGDTDTVATGTDAGALTVIVALALLPSLVAVTCVEPAATAVTRPLELTVAIALLPLDQVTTRPVSTLLFASRVVAVTCTVAPGLRVDDDGDTETVATGTGAGAVTVMLALPV